MTSPINYQRAPTYQRMAVNPPGYGLGVASLVLALCGLSVLPVVLGLVSISQARQVGASNGFALAGVVIGLLEIFLGLVLVFGAVGWMWFWLSH